MVLEFNTDDYIAGHNYAYLVTDLRTNEVLAELPFQDVSYNVKLSEAGEFNGTLFVNDETSVYDLRNTLFPGRVGLYVVRDEEPVWGGIIWKRKYDSSSRKLSIIANGFESYLGAREQLTQKTFTNTDQLDIARWLLENGGTAQSILADVSDRTSPRKRDRTFNRFEHKTVLDELTRLGNLIDGFDWNVEIYKDPETQEIRRLFQFYYTARGVPADQTDLYWEYPGSIRTFTLSEDADAGANVVYAIGAGEGVDQLEASAVVSEQLDQGFPILEKSRSYKSVVLPQTLQSHAEKDRDRLSSPITIFEVTVSANDEPQLGSYAIGDWARFRIEDQFVTPMIDQYARITGISVTIDDGTGLERVALTLGGEEVTTEDEL